jgi:hypothetical protein
MSNKCVYGLVLVACVLAQPLAAQSQPPKLPVPVPQGTVVSPVKYGDAETAVELKPAEQVAFLFVYAIWAQEQKCLERDTGIGRLATLGELVKGVKAPGGDIGLKVTPTRDSNYNYDLIIVGADCLIRAIPRVKGIGAFAIIGTPKRMIPRFYFNPDGPDLSKAVELTETGFTGDGFSR